MGVGYRDLVAPPERSESLQRLLEATKTDMRRWTDANQHDPGIAMLELFAYVGDVLGYYAEVVGGEAYLGTARSRDTSIEMEDGT